MKIRFFALMGIIASLHANPLIINTVTIPHTQHENLTAEVSIGELFDKLTILQIKSERIISPEKLKNIHTERMTIEKTIAMHVTMSPALDRLVIQLKLVNEQLWEIEDAIREKEARQEFDQEFISLARSVYFTNDERGRIKYKINTLSGSRLVEEKQYANYETK